MKVCINCNRQATSSNATNCEYCGGNLVDKVSFLGKIPFISAKS